MPNYSFEQYDSCPDQENQIERAIGWSKYSQLGTTPDYYNACAPPDSFGVPYSIFTHQDEYRHCNAYSALVTFWPSFTNYREFIGIHLSQPLIIGQKYFISFHTVMSEYTYNGFQLGFPSNNIGIRLSTLQYNPNNPCPINNIAHLYSSIIINDSINWHRVAGSIIADSMYEYIIAGNFFDDPNTDTLNFNCSNCLNTGSYYLIDDICLSTDSLLCNGGIDETACTVSLNKIETPCEFKLFPLPVSNSLNILLGECNYDEIEIYNILGKIIYSNQINNEKSYQINLSMFTSGIYFIKMKSNRKQLLVSKIIKL